MHSHRIEVVWAVAAAALVAAAGLAFAGGYESPVVGATLSSNVWTYTWTNQSGRLVNVSKAFITGDFPTNNFCKFSICNTSTATNVVSSGLATDTFAWVSYPVPVLANGKVLLYRSATNCNATIEIWPTSP